MLKTFHSNTRPQIDILGMQVTNHCFSEEMILNQIVIENLPKIRASKYESIFKFIEFLTICNLNNWLVSNDLFIYFPKIEFAFSCAVSTAFHPFLALRSFIFSILLLTPTLHDKHGPQLALFRTEHSLELMAPRKLGNFARVFES